MFSDTAIEAKNLTKCYQIYDKPLDRLLQSLWHGRRQYYRSFYALRNASFELQHGEVLGIVGVNGAGKSTLLRLVSGVLAPTGGSINVRGRVSALLELGSGFHPDFSGRENVYMNAAILGLTQKEIEKRYEAIVRFAEIGDFIHQPVKTYSSGMRMRLAFAVAVNVDPDILIIDEALSVGDGAFSRKSFERIMELKRSGTTILFCSHSTYQIEKLCTRALWLDRGEIQAIGEPSEIIKDYLAFLDKRQFPPEKQALRTEPAKSHIDDESSQPRHSRITNVKVLTRPNSGNKLTVVSGESELTVEVAFDSDGSLPAPTVGIVIMAANGRLISSAGSHNDGMTLERDSDGKGKVTITFPCLPLLRGDYHLDVYLACENAIRILDSVLSVAKFHVTQRGIELGVVNLPHTWQV